MELKSVGTLATVRQNNEKRKNSSSNKELLFFFIIFAECSASTETKPSTLSTGKKISH